jgi:N-acetylglutamate synthase-like GNAT family acetyltransferase
MALPGYRVRRATLEDLGPLTALWRSMNFSVENLSRRVTEFQVVEHQDGTLAGAIGLEIVERQGCIHSEGFVDFGLADELRARLWDRLRTVAANYGLLRLWTLEKAPFWSRCVMQRADAEALERLPAAWREPGAAWLTLKLKEDLDEIISADKEFAIFMTMERQRTQQVVRQARLMKTVLNVVTVGILILIVIGALWVLRKNPHLLGR